MRGAGSAGEQYDSSTTLAPAAPRDIQALAHSFYRRVTGNLNFSKKLCVEYCDRRSFSIRRTLQGEGTPDGIADQIRDASGLWRKQSENSWRPSDNRQYAYTENAATALLATNLFDVRHNFA